MKNKELLLSIGRFLAKILGIEIVIFLFAGIVCWLAGWHTVSEFGIGLIYVGVVAIILGAGSVRGAAILARSPTVRYIQTVTSTKLHDRTKQHMQDMEENKAFLFLLCVVGIITVVLGSFLATTVL
jgi:Na+/melibiose symporter-like transporter